MTHQITVVVHPSEEVSIDAEIEAVRLALLYGDQVNLVSMRLAMLLNIERFVQAPLPQKAGEIAKLTPFFMKETGSSRAKVKSLLMVSSFLLRVVPFLPAEPRSRLFEIGDNFDSALLDSMDQIYERIDRSQWTQVHTLLRDGYLKIDSFSSGVASSVNSLSDSDRDLENDLRQFYKQIILSLSVPGQTPMLDGEIANIVKLAVERDNANFNSHKRIQFREGGIAQTILSKLPNLDDIPIDEVLDVRKDLEEQLVGFRKAILGFSSELQSERWDDSFSDEVNHLYRLRVHPKVIELEGQINSKNYLR